MDEQQAFEARREAGRLLFAQDCVFINGSTKIETIPEAGLPEVAFAGRSNVGKSSLLNALTGRNSLARVSNTPGRTQQLNFFALGGRLMLVDLPGYGYAEASKTEIARWTKLVETYLKGRQNLTRTCVLIDARHGIKPPDEPVFKMLRQRCGELPTRADQMRQAEAARAVGADFRRRGGRADPYGGHPRSMPPPASAAWGFRN